MSAPVRLAGVLAAALSVHSAVNAALLRRPPRGAQVREPISVLLPVRDETARVTPCLRSLLAQQGCADLELVVLDDGSVDGTPELVRHLAGDAVRLLAEDGGVAEGWLGKTWACHRLAAAARPSSTVLVFLDADVVLAPDAVAATVALLRRDRLDLVSPYPRQIAVSAAERLVQPLLQWSWLTLLPLRVAERSARPSLAAANGQLLAVDRAAYRHAGGHAGIRGEVLDDVALLRAVKAAGGRGGVADGTRLATCRMYDGRRALTEGYTKSLWAAGGSPLGSTVQVGLLAFLYLLPAAAALRGSRAGLAGYLAGVAGRLVTGGRTGARLWPDAWAHPLSIAALAGLTARSWRGHRAGTLTWKGRTL